MHSKVLMIFLVLSSSAFAASLKKAPEFMQDLKQDRARMMAEKSVETKKARLLEIKKNFETTLEAYKKKNPNLGTDEETAVDRIYETFDPVFGLMKTSFDTKDCEKASHQLRFADLVGKPEGAALSPEAQEADAWLKLFCK